MDDIISRQAAIELLRMALDDSWEPDYASDRMGDIPAADVRPVVRGEWICLYDGNYKCSECGEWYSVDVTPIEAGMFYCPNCGADVGGERDE